MKGRSFIYLLINGNNGNSMGCRPSRADSDFKAEQADAKVAAALSSGSTVRIRHSNALSHRHRSPSRPGSFFGAPATPGHRSSCSPQTAARAMRAVVAALRGASALSTLRVVLYWSQRAGAHGEQETISDLRREQGLRQMRRAVWNMQLGRRLLVLLTTVQQFHANWFRHSRLDAEVGREEMLRANESLSELRRVLELEKLELTQAFGSERALTEQVGCPRSSS